MWNTLNLDLFNLKSIVHVIIQLIDCSLVNFINHLLIEFSNNYFAIFNFILKIDDLTFEFSYLWNASFVQISQVLILCKSLEMTPKALSIFHSHLLTAQCTDLIYRFFNLKHLLILFFKRFIKRLFQWCDLL